MNTIEDMRRDYQRQITQLERERDALKAALQSTQDRMVEIRDDLPPAQWTSIPNDYYWKYQRIILDIDEALDHVNA